MVAAPTIPSTTSNLMNGKQKTKNSVLLIAVLTAQTLLTKCRELVYMEPQTNFAIFLVVMIAIVCLRTC